MARRTLGRGCLVVALGLAWGLAGCRADPSAAATDAAPASATPSEADAEVARRDDATVPVPVAPVAPVAVATVGELLEQRPWTFVRGTAGDARSDQVIAGQIELVKSLSDSATVVDDASIDVAAGAAAWPAHAIVYGGPHVNSVMARLAPVLPFELGPSRLVIGGETLTGDDLRLIAAIPARARDARGPDHPAFVLYAGTGTPGVAEVNAIGHGRDALVIADAFGPLRTGTWVVDAAGAVTARLAPPGRRIAWRAVPRDLPGVGPDAASARVRVLFPAALAPASDEEALVAACVDGLAVVVGKLALARPAAVDVYVYPDRGSKRSLTGDPGDGHAVPAARALHVVATAPDALERLMAHEGTHVLAAEAWGTAASPFAGEGLAVWVAGGYGGRALGEWRVPSRPALGEVLAGLRRFPEALGYPIAGTVVAVVVERLGLERMRALYTAPPAAWAGELAAAGLGASALDEELARRLGR